jgi:hypothetical protein
MTYGVKSIVTPCPRGPVTRPTVSHVVEFSGNDERRVTLRSGTVPVAVTWAPPLRRICPVGHEVWACTTAPACGSGAECCVGPRVTLVAASVPPGPALPSGPCWPAGPWGPCGPCDPVGPETFAGCVATAYAATPSPASPSTEAMMTTGTVHLGADRDEWFCGRVCDSVTSDDIAPPPPWATPQTHGALTFQLRHRLPGEQCQSIELTIGTCCFSVERFLLDVGTRKDPAEAGSSHALTCGPERENRGTTTADRLGWDFRARIYQSAEGTSAAVARQLRSFPPVVRREPTRPERTSAPRNGSTSTDDSPREDLSCPP